MTSLLPVQCRACARYAEAGTCEAYPAGIPVEISTYGGDHRKPWPGDGGVRFRQGTRPAQVEAFEQWDTTFGSP